MVALRLVVKRCGVRMKTVFFGRGRSTETGNGSTQLIQTDGTVGFGSDKNEQSYSLVWGVCRLNLS